jgi:2-oxo-4-hydroxy-4-carboxy-5-ureidoimidazoline decarboxylase
MLTRRPYHSVAALYAAAQAVWDGLERADYLEAFSHHPQIGGDIAQLRARFAATSSWASQEQAGVASAAEGTLEALRAGNLAYAERFGHIFIVCATGKTAEEMLALLQARLGNEPDQELKIATGEQAKITRIRLEKLGA